MDQIKGAQSIMFREAPYLISAASVAGSKEADGPIGKLFDVTDKDDLFGAHGKKRRVTCRKKRVFLRQERHMWT